MKKVVFSLLAFALSSVFTHAQSLESLYFTNLPVTEDEQLGIGAKMFFTASHCSTGTWHSELESDGVLRVTVEYSVGLVAQPCSLTDTIYINPVPAGDYTLIYDAVSVSGTFQDSDTLPLTVDVGTGVYDKNRGVEGVRVYPNPATDVINIEFTGDLRDVQAVYLRDLSGSVVESFPPDSKVLQVSDFTPGMYVLSLITARGVITRSLVIR